MRNHTQCVQYNRILNKTFAIAKPPNEMPSSTLEATVTRYELTLLRLS